MQLLKDLLKSVSANNSLVKRVLVGVHWTVVESEGGCGMASTTSQPPPHYNTKVRDVGSLEGKTTIELAEYIRSEFWLEASIGLAALNSMLNIDETLCNNINAYDLLREKGAGKNVVIIGHFPFVKKLRSETAQLWVLEKEPREGDTPASEAGNVLPICDVVGISATTLINHTLEEVLSHCREDAFKIMVGPSTPMTPVLFDYNLNALGGCKIVNPELVFKTVAQGANFKQVEGVRLLTMQRI